MAIITSTLVLRLLTLTRLYAAYLLLTSPATLLSQNLILVLGSAMRLPIPQPARSTNAPITALTLSTSPTPATGLAALAVALFALSDLSSTTLPEFAYDEYWSVQCIGRVIVFAGVAVWVYVTKPEGTTMGVVEDANFGRWRGDGLRNALVFAWCFVEMTAMFWVFIVLRDERTERAKKLLEEREKRRIERERGL